MPATSDDRPSTGSRRSGRRPRSSATRSPSRVEGADRVPGLERAGQPRAHHRHRVGDPRPARARGRRRPTARTSRTTSAASNEVWVEAYRDRPAPRCSRSSARSPASGSPRCARRTWTSVRRRGRRSGRARCATCSRSGCSTRGCTSRTCAARSASPAVGTATRRARRSTGSRRVMPMIVGKKVKPADGTIVVFEVVGPGRP